MSTLLHISIFLVFIITFKDDCYDPFKLLLLLLLITCYQPGNLQMEGLAGLVFSKDE